MAGIVVGAWLTWCLLNVAMLIAAPLLVGRTRIYTNGLRVVIPDQIRALLTDEEVAAVIAHERGHIFHEHALKNMARACFLVFRTEQVAFRQELEADDYAAARGHGPALARALLKLGDENQVVYRASRLAAR